jgi:DNA-binding SARP family transcriptional activator
MARGYRRLSAKAIAPAQLGLVRERLLAVAGSRLGVVLAPAGYGKTRLLAQVADSFPGIACWYRADSADRDPALLRARLGDAIRRALDTPGSVPAVPAASASWNPVIHAIAGIRQQVLLAVDDFHELDGSAAEQCLTSLIESAPANCRFLIAGRRWSAMDTRQLRVAGEPVVEAADLQFRSWEVERLFRDVYKEPLLPEDAASLTRRIGGWAAGLAMFQLLTTGRSPADRHRAVSELGGGSRLVRSYLVREVLEELQPEIRDFLRCTSALVVLTADGCDALLGRRDSQDVLDELERRQVFISSDDGVRYRYHQVLQDHLELELTERLGPSEAQAWYERAGIHLEAAGEVNAAFRAYVRAEQWMAVRRLLQARGADVVASSLGTLVDQIPFGLPSEDPWLVIAEARRLARNGTLARAVDMYRKAESLTTDLDITALCRKERRHAAVWLPGDGVTMTGNSLSGTGTGTAGSGWEDLVRAATRRCPGRAALLASARGGPQGRLAAGLAGLLSGALDEADTALRNAARDPGAGHDLVQAAVYARAIIGLLAGRVQADLPELEAVVLEAEITGQPWWARIGRALLEADSEYLTGLDQMTAQAEAEQDLWGCGITQLLSGLVSRRPAALDVAAVAFGQLDAPVLALWAQCLSAVLPGAAPDLLRQAQATSRALDAPGVLPAARRWAGQATPLTGAAEPGRHTVGLVPPQASKPASKPASDAASDPVELRLLGGFELAIGGAPVDQSAVRPRARKALHLLAMQAGRPVHRDVLAQAVWPDNPPDAARRSVHVAISTLRHLMEPDAPRGQSLLLPRLGDSYTLVLPDGARCDLLDFEAALVTARAARRRGDVAAERASLRSALSCYGGDLLPEDGAAEWVVAERERLRLVASDAGERLARAEAATGDVAAAVEQARRALSFDAYRDSAWRLLIGLHEQEGDQSAAHAARQQYGKMLAELGAGGG